MFPSFFLNILKLHSTFFFFSNKEKDDKFNLNSIPNFEFPRLSSTPIIVQLVNINIHELASFESGPTSYIYIMTPSYFVVALSLR